jgi:LysM repeat protein
MNNIEPNRPPPNKGTELPGHDTLEIRNAVSMHSTDRQNRVLSLLEKLSQTALAEPMLRAGTHILSIALVLLVVWVMRHFYLQTQVTEPQSAAVFAADLPTPTPTSLPPALAPFQPADAYAAGISRRAQVYTTIPTRPRTEVTEYEVQGGDTIFGIAEKFGLKPETILWGNYYVLSDNPHSLTPGQVLNILPVDGTYHKWSAGEGLNGVATGYNVTVEDIVIWPGNHLNPKTIGDPAHPDIEPGMFLFVPGGKRDFVTWSAPRITRDDPGAAGVIGPGVCGTITDGAVGAGAFIWPSGNHYLSGYDYAPNTNHFGIDIDGDEGDPIWAPDHGVVVYAGWNNFGYGNIVVIDHGNGWQTLSAHLASIAVACGQSVFQGSTIGAMGSTGKSSGPHLHYEMMHDEYGKVNPWDFLP